MGKINKTFDNWCNNLINHGINDMTNSDDVIVFVISIIIHFIILATIFLLIPNIAISIPIIIVISICVGIFIKMVGDDSASNIIFYVGVLSIPIIYVSYLFTIYIRPYRGKDKMRMRKEKLKRLIWKARFNKLKFWIK